MGGVQKIGNFTKGVTLAAANEIINGGSLRKVAKKRLVFQILAR